MKPARVVDEDLLARVRKETKVKYEIGILVFTLFALTVIDSSCIHKRSVPNPMMDPVVSPVK